MADDEESLPLELRVRRYTYRDRLREYSTGRPGAIDLSRSFDKHMGDTVFIQDFLPLFSVKTNKLQLDLNRNSLGDASLRALSFLLAQGRHEALEVIRLSENRNITDDGVIDLLGVLPKACPRLERIYLHGIEIGDTAMIKLAEVMPKMVRLSTLDVCARDVTDEGCCLLAKSLINHPGLTSLALGSLNASTTTKGLRALVRGMRWSKLKEMSFHRDNRLDPSFLQRQNIMKRTFELIKKEFPCIIALCSVRIVTRLGHKSHLRQLPLELFRRLAPMLFTLTDLDVLG